VTRCRGCVAIKQKCELPPPGTIGMLGSSAASEALLVEIRDLLRSQHEENRENARRLEKRIDDIASEVGHDTLTRANANTTIIHLLTTIAATNVSMVEMMREDRTAAEGSQRRVGPRVQGQSGMMVDRRETEEDEDEEDEGSAEASGEEEEESQTLRE